MAAIPSNGDINWGNALRDFLEVEHNADGTHSIISAVQTYTPVLSSSGGLTQGNASVFGRYVLFGDLCYVMAGITMGSTTTYGTTNFRFSLPKPPAYTYSPLSAYCVDASANDLYTLTAICDIAGWASFATYGTTGDGVDNLSPFTWAVSDYLFMGGIYIYTN